MKRAGLDYRFDDEADMNKFLDFMRDREGFSVVKDRDGRDRDRDIYFINREDITWGFVIPECLYLRPAHWLNSAIEEYVASRASAVDSSTSEQPNKPRH